MIQSPYQQNIDILKEFFRRPIVLVYSILIFVSVGLQISTIFTTTALSFNKVFSEYSLPADTGEIDNLSGFSGGMGSANVLTILLAVSFLLFYILSRKQENNLSVPSTIFKVISIIELVISCILIAIVLFWTVIIGIMSVAFSQSNQHSSVSFAVLTALFLILCLLIPVFIIAILNSIAKLMFANSIKKSLSSIYLKRSGSTFFGVMCFISAFGGIIISFLFLVMITYYSNQYGSFNMPLISGLILISNFIIGNATSIVGGILAVKYARYIKNVSQKFRIEVPSQSELEQNVQPATPVYNEPVIQNTTPDFNNPYEVVNQIPEAQTPPAPVQENFVQPAPVQQSFAEEPSYEEPVKEYIPEPSQPAQPPQADYAPRFCTECGKPVGPDDYFCNNCGKEIIRNI